MRLLSLTEHQSIKADLSREQFHALSSLRKQDIGGSANALTITPCGYDEGFYQLCATNYVGALYSQDVAIVIQPKITIQRVLFMMSYAAGPKTWAVDPWLPFDFGADSLIEAIIHVFVARVEKAFRRGILRGYRVEEESLPTVRGRIRFADQIRARYGLLPPVEVRYDEFTEDIEENRLIKAAMRRLVHLPIRPAAIHRRLRVSNSLLTAVSNADYAPQRLPNITYNRLNSHYRPAVELAKLVLQAISFDLSHGHVRSTSFLIDMNKVFEDFVAVAMRESLQLSEGVFIQNADKLPLDTAGQFKLKPDLSWWDGTRCSFVGDVKYKDVRLEKPDGADLYQLLAYMTAADLPNGLLVYAAGPTAMAAHTIVHVGKKVYVSALDLNATPVEILKQVERIAHQVKEMREAALAKNSD